MVGSSLSSPGVSARVVAVLLAAAMGSGAGAAPQAPAAPRARLRIAVIAGEDAVNIIQQRTAVAPIVEVRDENDQPIAGALVAFVVRGGRNARFTGNARTLSVTTDASGRATSTDLTPTGTGAVVIDVTARFQGQTATTTVTQTNFATAAQASAAGGAGGAGATTGAGVGGAGAGAATGSDVAVAGAGGGGLSGIAIAGIAAAAGGGLAAAVALKSDSPAPLTAPASGTLCRPGVGPPPYVLVVTNQAGAVVNLGCTQTRIMNGTATLDLQVSGKTDRWIGIHSGHLCRRPRQLSDSLDSLFVGCTQSR